MKKREDAVLYYDGDCGFCTGVVRMLQPLDLQRRVQWVAYQTLGEPPIALTYEDLAREIHIRVNGRYEAGFHAFRRLALILPPLWPIAPLLYFPGVDKLGEASYRWVAANRGRLSRVCLMK